MTQRLQGVAADGTEELDHLAKSYFDKRNVARDHSSYRTSFMEVECCSKELS